MYQEERMQSILEYIKENKRISVDEICTIHGVSRDTARRDLVNLEKNGAIVRTHGGAILPKNHIEVKDYNSRLEASSDEKNLIGKLAASLIKAGDNIIMDTSTTVQSAAEFINIAKCTIITNSINLADTLSEKNNVNIHLLGGKLEHTHRFLYGSATISMLSNYYVDKAFIGALGVTETGITVAHEEDAFVMKKMIEQANEVILLTDSSKFEKNGFFKVADLNKIDLIITDKLPHKKFLDILNKHKTNIIIAK